jgi:hypothetical protein
MKTLLILTASLFAMTAHAQTTFEQFTAYDQWVPLVAPDGTLMPNIIAPGEFYCTGGGEPDPTVPIGCVGGTGIHIRDLQGISCVIEPTMLDSRLNGMAWWNLGANWDSDKTGPVSGIWRIMPGDCIDMALIMDPESYWDDLYTYWEGTYTGMRQMVPDSEAPIGVKWISTIKYVGQGMGDLAGQKMIAVETITTYFPSPAPGEFFGIFEPEGILDVTIKTKY